MSVWNRNNRNSGFTLVELIIAIAIVGILGTAVFGFMTVGSRNFSEGRTEVSLQSESQLAYSIDVPNGRRTPTLFRRIHPWPSGGSRAKDVLHEPF